MKNVIAFSLWGHDPSYLEGIIANLRLTPIHYPGWTCRVYVASNYTALPFLQSIPYLEIIVKDPPSSSKGQMPWDGIYWRMLPAADPSIGYFVSRDCDGRLNAKEKAAVDEWIASGKTLHTMHVKYFHEYAIHGGLWGCRGGAIPDMQERIDHWLDSQNWRNQTTRESESDEKFLSQVIWPLFKQDYIGHNAGANYNDKGDNERDFPNGTVEHFNDFNQIKCYPPPQKHKSLLIGRRKSS